MRLRQKVREIGMSNAAATQRPLLPASPLALKPKNNLGSLPLQPAKISIADYWENGGLHPDLKRWTTPTYRRLVANFVDAVAERLLPMDLRSTNSRMWKNLFSFVYDNFGEWGCTDFS